MQNPSALPRSLLLAPWLAIAGVASAQDVDVPLGFYAGGAVTQSRFDEDEFSVDDLDDEDTSWKAIAGFRFHPNFAIEGQYVDFGEATAPAPPLGGPFAAEAKAFALYGVGLIPVGGFDLYAKLGAARIDGEGRFGDLLFEDDETEFAYGAGAQARFGNLGVRLEYEKYDTDVVGDLDLISLGLTYTFAAN
jgi:hypothetical protein